MKCMMFDTLLNEWYEMYNVGYFADSNVGVWCWMLCWPPNSFAHYRQDIDTVG